MTGFSPAALFAVAALALLPATLSSTASSSDWSGACDVRFEGKSTLHDFTGVVTAEPFTVEITDMEDPTRARAAARVVVAVAKMDTENKKRDREMRKTLAAERFPEIAVTTEVGLEDLRPRDGANGPAPTVVPATLELMGRDYEIAAAVSNWAREADSIRFTVAFPLSLEDLGIEPPTAMGGLIRVKDRIEVSAQVALERP